LCKLARSAWGSHSLLSDLSGNETTEDDSDDEPHGVRGRRSSKKSLQRDVWDNSRREQHPTYSQQMSGPIPPDYSNEGKQVGSMQRRMSFTRSRSPHPQTLNNPTNGAHSSPVTSSFPQRHKSVVHALFPATISARLRLPFLGTWIFCMDTRYMAESLLLIGSLAFSNSKLSDDTLHTVDSSVSIGDSIICTSAKLHFSTND